MIARLNWFKMALPLLLPTDIKEWARTKKFYEGRFLLSQMDRLKPRLHEGGSTLKEEFIFGMLQFGVDPDGWSFIRGRLDGALPVTCQRCLRGMNHPIALDFGLCFVQNEAELKAVPDGYDPLILKDFSGRLGDLVEDELLLGLPVVTFHTWDQCLLEENARKVLQQSVDVAYARQKKPFRDLKKQLEKSGF